MTQDEHFFLKLCGPDHESQMKDVHKRNYIIVYIIVFDMQTHG